VVNIRFPFVASGPGDDEIEDLRPSGIELLASELVVTDRLGMCLVHRGDARDRGVIDAGDEPGPLGINLRRVGDDTDRSDPQDDDAVRGGGPG
jgi:hypothetical protein